MAYIDESGNTGDPAHGGSLTYSLGCVLVDADLWPNAFERLLEFRRRIRTTYGVPMRAEIKANYLLRSSGDLRVLSLAPAQRQLIYRAHMRLLQDLPARSFAVVVDKRTRQLTPAQVFDLAWEGLLQRLERTSRDEGVTFALLHDEGENDAIRRWVRKARRFLPAGSAFGTGSLQASARLLVDDPISRRSHQSYFVQLADLVAYAAFRGVVAPGGAVAQVCPQNMWNEAGPAIAAKVTGLRPRSEPGIVLR